MGIWEGLASIDDILPAGTWDDVYAWAGVSHVHGVTWGVVRI
jgi:hypothetical protein